MTPAVRAAKAAGIAFEVREYDPGVEADTFGEAVARSLGVEPERVFKTLVVRLDGKQLAVAVVPVATKLDLKALAHAAGGKKAEMADPKSAERATGYVVGGISPLGQKKRLPTFVDDSVSSFETVLVSAGKRGIQIELAPADLLATCGGRSAAIGRR